jgi:hypothetical protein
MRLKSKRGRKEKQGRKRGEREDAHTAKGKSKFCSQLLRSCFCCYCWETGVCEVHITGKGVLLFLIFQ